MSHSRGYKVENNMRKFFKGKKSPFNEVDFETSTSLYEVKSCRLFCKYGWKNKYNRRSWHHGRYQIKTDNHIMLYLRALQLNKEAKYIFVLNVQGQYVWIIKKWKEVKLDNSKDIQYVTIREAFDYL